MKNGKTIILWGVVLVLLFAVWTILIQTVDVKPVGTNSTNVGLSTLNTWFFELTGVHLTLYIITDWLGLVPLLVCILFGVTGFVQLIKRKSLLKIDADILILGIYYILVIFVYFLFEVIPVNYRPILINGCIEASYPSSTTLLVLSVMPTLTEQINRRLKSTILKNCINILVLTFSAFMVIARLISGVHWITDIVGGVLLSTGLFCIYKGTVMLSIKSKH